MSVKLYPAKFEYLSEEQLAKWAEIPAAVVSDCQNRGMAMQAAIKPIDRTRKIVGQARTVDCMVADNSALHAAIQTCEPGDILVANGQGFEDVAIWGGLMTQAALEKGVRALVLDGAVRDVEEIIENGFPVFARAVVPRGPHKGFGGAIDRPVACGGVSVSPGDLVIGDADGVAIVPLGVHEQILQAATEKLAKEEEVLEGMRAGKVTLAEMYGVPEIERVE